ncbi:MAG: DUF1552 domain-containing protein [Steroidobacteraceae bacterium]
MTRPLSRRTLLRGAGALIALPYLEAMSPIAFAATRRAAEKVARMMYVYAPTGMMPHAWTPTTVGTDFEFQRIMKPLEKFRNDITVISGLGNNSGNLRGDAGGDHVRAVASYLTGVPIKGREVRAGTSVDQIAARVLGQRTKFASLEVACEDSRLVGGCDGASCAYQTVSWKSPTEPLPPEINPRALFERMFGDLNVSSDPVERKNQQDYRKSILDLTLADTKSLQKTLGGNDRRKLDEYLSSIREVEIRLGKADSRSLDALPAGAGKPNGIPASYAEHARLMFDLIAIAFQTDMTRVSTFMMAREGGARPYPEIGVPEAHHPVSHHGRKPDLIEKLIQIECYHLEQFAYFVEKLKSIKEGDGTLLDNCAIVYGAAMGDPQAHDHDVCPTLVAGHANGRIKRGQHIKIEKQTPMANLHLTMLELAGVPTEKFGDANGKLDFLTGI